MLKDKKEYLHSVAVYQKYLTRLGEMIILSPRLENYQFSQPRSIFSFYIRQHYVCILCILNHTV